MVKTYGRAPSTRSPLTDKRLATDRENGGEGTVNSRDEAKAA